MLRRRILTPSKSELISEIYQKDFGSIAAVHKDAKVKDSSISRANVEDWMKENVKEKPQKNGLPVKVTSTLTKDKINIIEGAFYHEHGYGTPEQTHKDLKKE